MKKFYAFSSQRKNSGDESSEIMDLSSAGNLNRRRKSSFPL